MAKFRFQDLRIWQLAIEIANELFDIADELERKRLYRFAGVFWTLHEDPHTRTLILSFYWR